MNLVSLIIVGLVAFLHFYFLLLEMFLWTKPLGLKVFKQSLEQAQSSAVLAANQGLYNGFLGAGLVWGLVYPEHAFAKQIRIFFLGCVVIAGVFGACTVNRKIFFIQALPAVVGLALGILS